MRAGIELGVLCVLNACFAMEEARQRGPHPSDYTLGPLREVEFPQSLTGARLFEPGRRASQPPSNASVVESDPVRRTRRDELRVSVPAVVLELMLMVEIVFSAPTTVFCPHTVARGGRAGLSRRLPSKRDRGRQCGQTRCGGSDEPVGHTRTHRHQKSSFRAPKRALHARKAERAEPTLRPESRCVVHTFYPRLELLDGHARAARILQRGAERPYRNLGARD